MASFSVTKIKTEEQLSEAFSFIKVSSLHKDYHKDCYDVTYKDGFLSIKFPTLKVISCPKDGEKYFYACLSNKHDASCDFFESLDNHLSSYLPDSIVNVIKPTFRTDNGLVKLYVPHKGGVINRKKMKIFDSNKEIIVDIKEGDKIKVLAYLKQFKRYRDEVIPMWIVEQIQVQKEIITIPTDSDVPTEKEPCSFDSDDNDDNSAESLSDTDYHFP